MKRAVQFASFLVSGFLIFAAPLLFSGLLKTALQIVILALFCILTFYLNKTNSDKRYTTVYFAFSIAALVYFLDNFLYGNWPALNLSYSRMDQYVLAKLASTILIVVPIIVLTKFSHQSMSSLFLSKGKWKLGLLIGTILFGFFLLTSVPAATLLYGGKDLTYGKLFTWIPWIFTFVLANGIREELLFRGLFLKKYQAFFSLGISNLLQATIFVMPHFGETYSPVMIGFLVIVFALGLAFGAVAQKTNSLIGSIIFHAGTDIPVILGIFSNFS